MDERTAQLYLELLHLGRGELPPEQAAAVEQDLRQRPGGEALLREDREFDKRMRSMIFDVPVPPGLKGGILDRLAERRAVKFRRRLWQGLAMAASIMVAVPFFYNLSLFLRPDLDAVQLAGHYEPQSQPASDEALNAWLAEQDLAFTPDMPFDTSLLTGWEMVEFEGRTVPMLMFVNQGAVARVYIVKSGKFNLETEITQGHQSYTAVRIVADRYEPKRRSYVVVLSRTHDLGDFLATAGA